jgi:c-di-GMP-binding flagellar brake protein YcgR
LKPLSSSGREPNSTTIQHSLVDSLEKSLKNKLFAERIVKKEEKETKPRYGIVNFEKRKYPRYSVNLPMEYARSDSIVNHGQALNASEGGLLVYFPERVEIGQHLSLKLFFSSVSEFNTIETLVEVVWVDVHMIEEREDYRAGVKFVDISPGDLEKLTIFLRSLSG